MRPFVLTLLGLVGLGCNSTASPADCTAAGGECVLGGAGNACAKQGPSNTCNCNPECNPGGGFCCIAFIDAGDAATVDSAAAD